MSTPLDAGNEFVSKMLKGLAFTEQKISGSPRSLRSAEWLEHRAGWM